jgi:hypothetical protein
MTEADPSKPPTEALAVAEAMYEVARAGVPSRGLPPWDEAMILQLAWTGYAKAAIGSLAEQGFINKRGLKALEVHLTRAPPT